MAKRLLKRNWTMRKAIRIPTVRWELHFKNDIFESVLCTFNVCYLQYFTLKSIFMINKRNLWKETDRYTFTNILNKQDCELLITSIGFNLDLIWNIHYSISYRKHRRRKRRWTNRRNWKRFLQNFVISGKYLLNIFSYP